jgi:hypothetical protein
MLQPRAGRWGGDHPQIPIPAFSRHRMWNRGSHTHPISLPAMGRGVRCGRGGHMNAQILSRLRRRAKMRIWGSPLRPGPESPGRTKPCRVPISERPRPGHLPPAFRPHVSRPRPPSDCSVACAMSLFGPSMKGYSGSWSKTNPALPRLSRGAVDPPCHGWAPTRPRSSAIIQRGSGWLPT